MGDDSAILLSRLEFLSGRLVHDVRGIPCDYVFRAYSRVTKLREELYNLKVIKNSIEMKYNDAKNKLIEYENKSSKLIKFFVTLLIVTVLATISITLMIALPGAPLSFLLPYLTIILVGTTSMIVIIVILFAVMWTRLRSMYAVTELRKRISELKRRLEYYNRKIDDKTIELEDAEASFLYKEYYLCKCHSEFSEAVNLLVELRKLMTQIAGLIEKRDYPAVQAKIGLMIDILKSLLSIQTICDSKHTIEYTMKISANPDIIAKLSSYYFNPSKLLEDDSEEVKITVNLAGRNYTIDILGTMRKNITK